MIYFKYFIFFLEVQFLTYKSRMSFFKVEENDIEQLSQDFMDQIEA